MCLVGGRLFVIHERYHLVIRFSCTNFHVAAAERGLQLTFIFGRPNIVWLINVKVT